MPALSNEFFEMNSSEVMLCLIAIAANGIYWQLHRRNKLLEKDVFLHYNLKFLSEQLGRLDFLSPTERDEMKEKVRVVILATWHDRIVRIEQDLLLAEARLETLADQRDGVTVYCGGIYDAFKGDVDTAQQEVTNLLNLLYHALAELALAESF